MTRVSRNAGAVELEVADELEGDADVKDDVREGEVDVRVDDEPEDRLEVAEVEGVNWESEYPAPTAASRIMATARTTAVERAMAVLLTLKDHLIL